MKALVRKNNKIEFEERDVPKILHPRDVIVKVKLSSICTSDLHIIGGFVPFANNNIVLGHEFVGEVIETGAEIETLKPGDRVSANCETFCGECYFCKHGFINNCIKGGWQLGCKIDGCQAEYVRVPYADCGLTKLPDNVSYENALFVGDILSSGYFGAEMCDIKEGDNIAVIGAGPVGLCTMLSARTFKAGKIFAIDINESRIKIAKDTGLADYIFNPAKCNIKEEIARLTADRGADGIIEAAGGGQDTFDMAWEIARPNAVVGIVAMYEENLKFPLPSMYGKNLTFKTGGVDAIHCKKLVNMISDGKINTDFLITHKFPFEKITEAYDFFKTNKDNCLKVALVY